MAELFKERYRELPAFKEALRLVQQYDEAGWFSQEEMATRILILNEDALNWDTLCKNCGVLMDDNYAQYEKIRALEEDLAYAENEIKDLNEEIRCAHARYDNEGL